MSGRKKKVQQTIEGTLGRDRVNVTVKKKAAKESLAKKKAAEESPVKADPQGPLSTSRATRLSAKRSDNVSQASRPGALTRKAASDSDSAGDKVNLHKRLKLDPKALGSKSDPVKKPVTHLTNALAGNNLPAGQATRSRPAKFAKLTLGDNKAAKKPLPGSTVMARQKANALLSSEEDDEPVSKASSRCTTTSRESLFTEDSDSSGGDEPIRKTSSRGPTVSRESLFTEDSDSSGGEEPTITINPQPVSIKPVDADDSEGGPLISPPKPRRRLVRKGQLSQSEHQDGAEATTLAAPQKATRRHRTMKEKAKELRRRRLAGEKLDMDDLSSSSSEVDEKPLYDYDSDNQALAVFLDDEEGVPNGPESDLDKKEATRQSGNDQTQDEQSRNDDDSNDSEDNIADFIVDDGNIGVPADLVLQIPMGLTRLAQKTPKEYFRTVVDWLISFRLNKTFRDRTDEIYRVAWDKLEAEATGLANSKFISSTWKSKFNRAMRARPVFNHVELRDHDQQRLLKCEACGRSGHPAKYEVRLTGEPYYTQFSAPGFLEPVEFESASDDAGNETLDEEQNIVPEKSTVWLVGSNCFSNAQTAHSLLHWRRELLELVDEKLERDGWMKPEELVRQERMTHKGRCKLVDEVIDSWATNDTIEKLWKEYSQILERARNQDTNSRRSKSSRS
ncbi:hypothetical protein QBC47DRAFT_391407 [Echria macrotheca]|uniref:DUF4211 domain-containing protein n=1 Tax=Echria macrotheca TaxID=438768 RepID=A0AAJ0B584_9PEZI|nr:hypothetical protein QBC47DRAFT_391407 [Echria macrotheca]